MTERPVAGGDGVDLDRFISDSQRLLYPPRAIRQRLEDHGIMVLPASFYSSVLLLKDLDTTFEGTDDNRHAIYDKIFRRSLVSESIARMAGFSGEFDPPISGSEDDCTEFFWGNSQFSFSDAMAYYCLVRALRPRRIVEIGSGFSTLAAAAAIRRNGFGEIICIEPYPRPFLAGVEGVSEIVRQPIQAVTPDRFAGLIGPADLLFIDSTHTVKIGSDCLYIYLVLLPSITKPLMVHSHDIFLPFGMPLHWARDLQIHWTEQYLLYAYLVGNSRARVVFGSNYAANFLAEETTSLMGGKSMIGGSSLWYEINIAG